METFPCFMLSAFVCFLLAPSRSESKEHDKWGPWGEWSPCSRTCGVGVSFQERECLEKEKPEDYCKGRKRMDRTCNIQDCPEDSRDFRLEQCEVYNNQTVDGIKYKWMPYIPKDDRCSLNCMPKGHFFFYSLADKVVDGTKCSMDSYDICVDGRCEKLGCDLILNSNAKEDKCRVCNGNGENCKTYKDINTEDGDDYKEIFVIPASATNINIQELAPSSNFLALSDSSENYVLNGDYIITNPKKRIIAGAVFTYERTAFGQERIFSLGPTSIPIHVKLLLLGEKNPGISYEFSVPKSVIKLPERAQFTWRTGGFDKCSKTCAGGEQKRRVFCVRVDSGEEVSKSKCDYEEKPHHKQKCNAQPCPASWFVSGWSTCSRTCGRGKQVRRVHCQHIVDGGETQMIPDDQCPDIKPTIMGTCQMQKLCPDWSAAQWSKCNVSCGLGFKHRNVTCQTIDTKKILTSESCKLALKPKEKMQCNPGPCSVAWIASNWSECYPNCGKGMSTRMVYCVSITDNNQKYPDELCGNSSRPISDKECFSDKLCPAMWHASQWSKCTATCGVGMQMRNVVCAKKEGAKMLRILSNDQCRKEIKMNQLQKCSEKPCQAGWYIYPWESCSKTCGMGIRRRRVKCFADSKEDPEEKWCKAIDKPITEEQCFEEKCKVPTTSGTSPTQTTKLQTTTASIDVLVATSATTKAAEATEVKEKEITAHPTATTTTEATSTEESTITGTSTPAPSTTTSQQISTTAKEKTPTTKVAIAITTEAKKEEKTTTAKATTVSIRTEKTETEQVKETTTTEVPSVHTTKALATILQNNDTTVLPTETIITQPHTTEVITSDGTIGSQPLVTTKSIKTQLSTTETISTQAPSTETSSTQAPTAETSSSQAPTTEITSTQLSTAEIISTQASTTETISTQAPTTKIGSTQTSTTETISSPPSTTEITGTQPSTIETISTQPPTAQITSTQPSTQRPRHFTESISSQLLTTETVSTQPPSIESSTTPALATTASASTVISTTVRRVIAAKITEPPEDTMAYKGTEVLFRCRATGYPKPVYTWRKGKIPVSSLDSLRIQILSNGDLKISDITEDDDDIYTCTSTNWVGPMDNRRARLSVIAPISVSVSPTNIAVNSEEDVKVTCVAAGVPKPTVEWYKGENLLTSQNRVQVTDTELVISKVQTSDSGYYTCRAYHDYGANNAKVYLNVIKKEEPTTPPVAKCEDSSAIAYCPVVKRVGYCCLSYYQKACCKTCGTVTCY